MNLFRRTVAIGCSAVLLLCNCFTAFADTSLPDGTAVGLPEKLTVLDSDGGSPNEAGEYFFHVENMSPYETYSKDIQIMNLREDKAYHIYFYALPLTSDGDLDLENNCTAVFTLNNEEIFQGTVTGKSADGSRDISTDPIDLGLYEPGQSRKLTCKVTWNGETAGDFVDKGHRLVSNSGVEVLREESGEDYTYGEVDFKWVFYAVVDESYTPPNTGVLSPLNIVCIIASAVVAVMIILLILLIFKKKKEQK